MNAKIKSLLIINQFFLLSGVLFMMGCENDYLTINAFEAEGTTVNYNLPDTTSTLQVAVVSLTCSKQKSENLQKISECIRLVMSANPGVELISFGEAISGWYAENSSYISSVAEPIPGPFTDSISCYAERYSLFLSVGMAEKKEGHLYNTLVVFDPNGQIIGIHRKNTLTPEDENAGYSPMKNANVVSIKDFKAGLMICADVNGEWLTREYLNAEIDIILSAFASPIGLPSFNLISRRMGAWQIFPNRYGTEDKSTYSGLIYVSDPAGNIVEHRINSESFFIYTIVK